MANVWQSGAHLFCGLNVDGAGCSVYIGRQLVGAVFDQGIHAFRGGFEVKLERDNTLVVDESLIYAGRTGCNPGCACRDFKGITVPVEGG